MTEFAKTNQIDYYIGVMEPVFNEKMKRAGLPVENLESKPMTANGYAFMPVAIHARKVYETDQYEYLQKQP